MDPQAPAPNQPTQEPAQPTAPQPAMTTPAPEQTAQTTQTPMMMPASSSAGKSKAGLIIGIIVGIVALLVIAFFVYALMFSPAAMTKKTSNAFMKYMNAGDIDKAASITMDGDQQDTKDFLKAASEKTKGGYKLQEKTLQDGKGYFLYGLDNATTKYSRTIVEKHDGKWMVSSYVFGANKLALIPGTAKEETPTTTTTTTTTSTKTCLAQDDYKWANYDKKPSSVEYDSTYNPAANTFNHTGDMFFKPDSTNEASFVEFYDDYADFAKHNADKQWKLHLEGSTYGSDAAAAASKKLANERAQKVKDEMVKRGVPADQIVIDPPHDYGSESQDDSKDKIYRRVQVTIDPTCTSTSTTTSGSNR